MDRRRTIFLASTVFALGFDQLSKVWARHVLLPIYPRVVTVIPRVWEFRYSENPGAAFGLLRNIPHAHLLFVPIALAIAIGAFIYLKRAELRRPTRVAIELGLIVGGALGNAFDRVSHGAVIDFINYQVPGIISNVSNLADHAIVLGVLIIVAQSWRADATKDAAEAETSGNENHS